MLYYLPRAPPVYIYCIPKAPHPHTQPAASPAANLALRDVMPCDCADFLAHRTSTGGYWLRRGQACCVV
jgi:hypothetical protein